MIWTLEQLRDKNIPLACINGKWCPARPLNNKYRTLKERLIEAWKVFTGEAEAFIWPEGQ